MELYNFQKEAIRALLRGKHIAILQTGAGKTAISLVWAKSVCAKTGKNKVLVVTTASKANMKPNDFEIDADRWCSPSFRKSLSSFSILSWHKLSAWVKAHERDLMDWVVIFDEVAKSSAGVSSGMGKAFLKITACNHDWAGFTATPGDVWIKFYPYLQACGYVKHKTEFMRKYCVMQTFKGYPEIVNYLRTDELKEYWKRISIAPDTSQMTRELPSETHKTLGFKKPSTYNRTLKTRVSPDGDMLDTPGALCAELRRQCFTKDKKQWITDFVESLGDGVVMFYNFIKTGDELEEVVKKAMPKGAKVWRIDGKHHDIPTAETIGKYDVVLCQWQSGSEALNLQFLHYWVAVELCYSYSTAVQARGRIKRLGQKRNMRYYYLLTDGTIEQAILKCLKNKSEFSEEVWTAELKERRER